MYSVEELQKIIDTEIITRSKAFVKKNPVELYNPVDYTLEMGGKRLRPLLVLLSYNLFSEEVTNALPAAVATEVFHNFTLLHDDIMDKADMRRNRPTVHKKFGENSAILSGDAMAFLAYRYLFECKAEQLSEVARLFTTTAIEVCEGQQFDMEFETRTDVSEQEYLKMIRLKTAVLLASSLKTGALLANANKNVADQLYQFGINLGLAFQLQDDLLDTFGDEKAFGKKIGSDILSNKKTYLLIKAMENANTKQLKQLVKWIGEKNFKPVEKIKAVKAIFNQLDIQKIAEEKINSFFRKSDEILNQLPVEDVKKQQLHRLSIVMLKRKH